MAKEKPDLIDWLGYRHLPGFSKFRWLGGLVSVVAISILAMLLTAALIAFMQAAWSDDPDGTALRNTGLVLAAMVGAPVLIWRSVVAQKQVKVADEALFNDKINAATDDLHARRLVTMNPDNKTDRWDYWQDDIVRRNAAIDRLEGLAIERPAIAPRIARMLSIYVRELSAENRPQVVPDEAKPDMVPEWARALTACRSDMENAAQTLGRLQLIDGVVADDVVIDLHGANLQGFDLHRASLAKAKLNGAQMQGADLIGAQMQEADLSEALMQGAHLRGAEMSSANLREAQNKGASLSFAQSNDVDFLNAYEAQAAERE